MTSATQTSLLWKGSTVAMKGIRTCPWFLLCTTDTTVRLEFHSLIPWSTPNASLACRSFTTIWLKPVCSRNSKGWVPDQYLCFLEGTSMAVFMIRAKSHQPQHDPPGNSWLLHINLQELQILIFLRVWGKEEVRETAVDQFQIPWYQTSPSSTFFLNFKGVGGVAGGIHKELCKQTSDSCLLPKQ